MTPPVIAVVGYSNSGKTRVASHLISTLSDKGYRVASIKHCHDGHAMDRSNSDTDRFRKAGASTVIASSLGMLTTIESTEDDTPLESIVPTVGSDIDIVIAEGFKESSVPKVLVVGNGSPPPNVENAIAVVSDKEGEWDLPTYGFDQLDMLANQLQGQYFGAESHNASVSLIVDGKVVPLKRYPESALMGVVKGFVSSLHGVSYEPRDIQLNIKCKGN